MRSCFCVVGWHYPAQFYEALYRVPGEKYIINHREADAAADLPFYRLIQNDLYAFPNRGLDFGAYHQFNESFDLHSHDFVVYCHDDIVINDARFARVIEARFTADPALMVIGNGNNGTDSEFRYGKYSERMFWPDDEDFVLRTVRGSFFAARTELFAAIGNFPVYWKAGIENMGKGNVSLRNFAYLVTKRCGREAIGYLEPESWLETRYLVEFRRGERVSTAHVER